MNILFLAHRIPYPPSRGDKVRSYNILKRLAAKNKVYVHCFIDDKNDKQYLPKLQKSCASVNTVYLSKTQAFANVALNFFSKQPWSLKYFYSKRFKEAINETLKKNNIDAIYAYSYQMAQYVLNVDKHKIMDLTDVESDKWIQYSRRAIFPLNLAYTIEGSKHKKYEEEIIKRFDKTLLISKREKELIQNKSLLNKIAVSPNGVDFEYFHRTKDYVKGNKIIFVGLMSNYKNIDAVIYFYDKIFPLVKEKIPQAEVLVVGKDVPKKIKEIAKKDKSVILAGHVADVRPYYEEASVSVAPMRIGCGLQNKVLEALAMGVPVVATSKAMEGIELDAEYSLYVQDDEKLFAEKIIEILQNGCSKEKLENCMNILKKKYNWDKTVEEIERLL